MIVTKKLNDFHTTDNEVSMGYLYCRNIYFLLLKIFQNLESIPVKFAMGYIFRR